MAIFIGWVGLSVLVGVLARIRGLGFGGGFLWSLILSPIVGAAITLVRKPNLQGQEQVALSDGAMKKCPHCAELIKAEARVCRFCSRDLPSTFSDTPCGLPTQGEPSKGSEEWWLKHT